MTPYGIRRLALFSLCCMLVVMVCGVAVAQTAGNEGNASSPVAVRKLTGVGNRALIFTPVYDTSGPGADKKLQEWGRVRVEYATRGAWLDEVTIRFYALGVLREDGKNVYSFYRKVVRYMDIKEGSDHMAEVYIRPSAIERYGELLATAVEFVIDGEVVQTAVDPRKLSALPADWWKNQRVIKSEVVTVRDAHILNRSESPFAYVNTQDFEAIK